MSIRPLILAALVTASTSAYAAAPATTRAASVDALDDDALLNELARRGLSTLLERAFELNKTPPKKRDAIRALAALNTLADESQALSAAQRREVVDRVAAGIDDILPTLDDPSQLLAKANLLIDVGVKLDVNTLEYWGQSTTTQAQLRPVVLAVRAMLERAASISRASAERLAARANPADSRAVGEIESLESLAQYAEQTHALTGYYLALCLDPSDPRRQETAEASIAFLSDYDFPENPALKNLKLVLGKLHLVSGEFDEARAALDAASELKTTPPEGMDPATFAQQQRSLDFESRYFRCVVEVLARQPDAARSRYDALLAWQQSAGLEEDPSIRTANRLLEYRILRAVGSDADRQRASGLLIDLLKDRPELEGQVLAQLRTGITSDTPVASLEPLLLRALMMDAREQVVRADEEPGFKPEVAVLNRGIEAAAELASRAGSPGVDSTLVAQARFLEAAFLEARGDRVEAAGKFVAVAKAHRDQLELARAALSNAQRLFAQLGGINSERPEVTRLYDEIVPLSLGEPFGQKELSYDWAYRLQQTGRPAEAIPFYRQVSPSDRRYAASRYYLMAALHQVLDQSPAGQNGDRQKICEEILSLADEVKKTSAEQLKTADSAQRLVLRQRWARTMILAADIARSELRDPERSLSLLQDVETAVAGLPDENQLLGEAMFTRIQANMQAGRSDEAVQGLVRLLNQSGGEQGATIVFNMLSKLEADFSLAEQAGDRERMAKLQDDRAALTPYLVKWSENNERGEIAKFAYSYRVYDAETQRRAAEFVVDPQQRATRLRSALVLFEALDSDAGRQQFKTSRTTPDRLGYDPQVLLGIARIRFALGEWSAARDAFARLLSDRALGTPLTAVTDAGQVRQVDNEVYWEATARLIRSRINAAPESADSLKPFLREQYVRWGDRVGGTKWKAEFDLLRQELIPDFVFDTLPQ